MFVCLFVFVFSWLLRVRSFLCIEECPLDVVHGERQGHCSHYRGKHVWYLKVVDTFLEVKEYGQSLTIGYLSQVLVQKETEIIHKGYGAWGSAVEAVKA